MTLIRQPEERIQPGLLHLRAAEAAETQIGPASLHFLHQVSGMLIAAGLAHGKEDIHSDSIRQGLNKQRQSLTRRLLQSS